MQNAFCIWQQPDWPHFHWQAERLYAMSASILDDRAGYYRILETSQKGAQDITDWLELFLHTLL